MKHFVLLLLLVVGGYFVWYYMNNREKVWAAIILKRHLLSVLALVGIILFFLGVQVTLHSTKIL